MTAILPDNIQGQSNYSLRNPQLESMLCHTNILFNSFLPSCIRLWNKLNPAIKQCTSLGLFKACLIKNTPIKINYFCFGPRRSNVILTRLRLNCAPINSYLFKTGALDSPHCRCGYGIETTHHYFLECPLYAIERCALQTFMTQKSQFNLKSILYGDNLCTPDENKKIIEKVYNFIHNSKRFI